MSGRDRKGITNVLGAILFVLAIVALTSIIAIVAAEYSNYVRSADYLSSLERERAMESLNFDAYYDKTSKILTMNITNVCGTTIKISHIYVHNKISGQIIRNESMSLPIVLNPGMSIYNRELNVEGSSLVMVLTSRGNNFLITIERGEVIFKS